LPRHQTLRATLDWSYALLPEAEQRLLCRLAVFQAGFTLDAAVAIMESESTARSAVIDGIANLVDKSLLASEHSQPGANGWRVMVGKSIICEPPSTGPLHLTAITRPSLR